MSGAYIAHQMEVVNRRNFVFGEQYGSHIAFVGPSVLAVIRRNAAAARGWCSLCVAKARRRYTQALPSVPMSALVATGSPSPGSAVSARRKVTVEIAAAGQGSSDLGVVGSPRALAPRPLLAERLLFADASDEGAFERCWWERAAREPLCATRCGFLVSRGCCCG